MKSGSVIKMLTYKQALKDLQDYSETIFHLRSDNERLRAALAVDVKAGTSLEKCPECRLIRITGAAVFAACNAMASYRLAVKYYALGRNDDGKARAESAKEWEDEFREALRNRSVT
jgi:hypothetical protein